MKTPKSSKTGNRVVVIFYIGISIAYLYHIIPLHKLADHIFYGDACQHATTINWIYHSLVTHARLFDANILHPLKNSLVYSEGYFGVGLLGIPLFVVGAGPVFVFNFLTYLSYVLAAYGMFLLVRDWTDNIYGPFLAGLIFGFSSFRMWSASGHLSILFMCWLPFCLLFLLRFMKNPSWKNCLLSSLFFILLALSNWYLMILGGLFLGLFYVIYTLTFRSGLTFRKHLKLLVGLLLVIVSILPFLLPYFRVTEERFNIIDALPPHSADLGGYFFPPTEVGRNESLLGRILLSVGFKKERGHGNSHFIGYLALFLASCEVVHLLKKGRKRWEEEDRISVIFLPLLLMVFVLSLGPFLWLFDKDTHFKMPYYYVYKFIPQLHFMRASGRFSIVVMLIIAWLAGLQASRFKMLSRASPKATVMVGLMSLVILLETFSLGAIAQQKFTRAAAYEYLAQQKGDFGVVGIPTLETTVLLHSTSHWKPLVNGIFLPRYRRQDLMSIQDLDEHFEVLLNRYDAKYLACHYPEITEKLKANSLFKQVSSDEMVTIFELSEQGRSVRWEDFVRLCQEAAATKAPHMVLSQKLMLRALSRMNSIKRSKDNPSEFRTLEKALILYLPPPPFPAAACSKMVFKLRARSATDRKTYGAIYWATENEPRMDEKKKIAFHVILDNAFHTYEIDLTSSFQWLTAGNITRLRLDLVYGRNINFEIEHIAFVSAAGK